jgi:hypothetical protein
MKVVPKKLFVFQFSPEENLSESHVSAQETGYLLESGVVRQETTSHGNFQSEIEQSPLWASTCVRERGYSSYVS